MQRSIYIKKKILLDLKYKVPLRNAHMKYVETLVG